MSELTRIGLLGGMSWESTTSYYRLLNQFVSAEVGGHASAPVTIWSADFAEIERLQRAGDWDAQGRILHNAALSLQQSGVELIALATNTLHLVADQITAGLSVPFLDLIDLVGQAAAAAGHTRVGLLATAYTMNSDLYRSRLQRYGVEVIVPDEDDRELVHSVIYGQLVHGIVDPGSKADYLAVVSRLADSGAQAVVLGCTEIALLISDGDATVPLIDTTRLHCQALSDIIINGVHDGADSARREEGAISA
ncbi:aspartate/glutamate racemase family protein [Jatrophihabitans telluris]|uniref:Aspartate/glutamate racemase family protein n=1 Tax=Jatrophihabitans telluris TaxID=2038343 RepID=A0ABY4R285_9ACTN|nr:aspartate/glutamate racemase family protein [Jatrophihabitans telluris]UQX89944.1 aspartate/glutamate racemase family protein [Jatrophihabitans telluris]